MSAHGHSRGKAVLVGFVSATALALMLLYLRAVFVLLETSQWSERNIERR